jgi:hypothetical protein
MLITILCTIFCLPLCCLKKVKIRICKNIILPVVLYACETCSLTLRQGHGLRLFENRGLRGIFGPKRVEVTGCKKLLHNLYSSPSIIRVIKSKMMSWAGHVARVGAKMKACRILGGKPEEGLNVDGWTMLQWILERQNGVVYSVLIWLRMRTSGGLL